MDVEVTASTGEATSVGDSQANPLKWCLWSVLVVAGLVVLCVGMLKLGSTNLAAGSGLDLDPNRTPDIDKGKRIYTVSCATCHGPAGKGLPHQGAPLDKSNFVHTSTDAQVITMIKLGRTAEDPKSVMKLPMPAKGNYANLTDSDLHDVVSFVRTLGAPATEKPKLATVNP